MRYNPCGAVVDYGRYSYDEWVKPFRDSDALALLRWYPALPSAPSLPYESQFLYQFWDKPYVDDQGVEHPPAVENPPSNRQKQKPTALGNHICGTAEDFRFGGLYLPLEPPVVYRPDGLPMCCSPVFQGNGGGVGSGTATVTYSGPYSGSGGGVGGGTADYRWGTQYVGIGGGVGSGTATVVGTNDRVGTGGGVASGIADVALGVWVEGTGGGVASGIADVTQNIHQGEGGGVASGTATVFATFTIGTGGGVASGIADVALGVWVEGTGGGVASGIADVALGVWIEGTGGGVGNGTADVFSGDAITGTGGGVGSGTATVTYAPPGDGLSCLTAWVLADGVPQSRSQPPGEVRWFVLDATTGSTITVTMLASAFVQTLTYTGSCGAPTVVGTLIGNGTASYGGHPTPDTFHFSVNSFLPGPSYTITVTMS